MKRTKAGGSRGNSVEFEDDDKNINLSNSDVDDWTFVSPPGSQSSSPSSSELGTRNQAKIKSLKKLCEQDTMKAKASSLMSSSPPSISVPPPPPPPPSPRPAQKTNSLDLDLSLAATSIDDQQQSTNEDSVSINGDDADDESDGMTEINLSDDNNYIANANSKIVVEKKIKFASPLCTDDEDTRLLQLVYKHIDSKHSHKSSSPSLPTTSPVPVVTRNIISSQSQSQSQHSSNNNSQQQFSSVNNTDAQQPPKTGEQKCQRLTHRLRSLLIGSMILNYIFIIMCLKHYSSQTRDETANELNKKLKRILDSSNRTFNFVYLDPSNHAYTELKLLDEEMVDCIRRENPNLQEIKQWLADDKSSVPTHDYNSGPNNKPFKGLVCYENEVEWRKKFNKLKLEHHIDLRKILKQVRRQLTYEMLELHHPSLRFKLIINQLEYLDFVDQRRKDRSLERLKAENFELSRRINAASVATNEATEASNKVYHHHRQSPSGQRDASKHQYQQQQQQQQHRLTSNSLISLESENKRLRQENEALKSSLAEKAGTIYIKQSIELEKCERENNALRQFHHQVAQEVSRGLKQLNLHITDFGAILSDRDESLSSPLAQTRGYLLRLVEEIGNLLAKNKGLKEDLSEARLLNALVVRDARNQVEDDSNQPPVKSDNEEFDTNSTTTMTSNTKIQCVASPASTSSSFEPEDNESNSSAHDSANECLTYKQARDFKVNWLMKRARLRERLRRSPDTIPSFVFDRPTTGPGINKRPAETNYGYSGHHHETIDEQYDDYNRGHGYQRKRSKQHFKSAAPSQHKNQRYNGNNQKRCKHQNQRQRIEL